MRDLVDSGWRRDCFLLSVSSRVQREIAAICPFAAREGREKPKGSEGGREKEMRCTSHWKRLREMTLDVYKKK